ncbi:MAG: GtrA family protein [Ruminococcus sp.]|nr:GtrA family protein [Ruminococcus sp.]
MENITEAEEQRPDIFDKIMHLPVFNIFEPFYKKNKAVLIYLFFGVLATAVSFVTAGISKSILEQAGATKTVISNGSTGTGWVCAVIFAYITNRTWVFHSKVRGAGNIMKEAASFCGGRLFTLGVELLMMWVGYTLLDFNYWIVKITANVVVVILNYVISKLMVFREIKEKNEAADKKAP